MDESFHVEERQMLFTTLASTMSFDVHSLCAQTFVVTVGPHLDFRNVEPFEAQCLKRIEAGARMLILDFSDTNMLDSRGLGTIRNISAVRQLRTLGYVR